MNLTVEYLNTSGTISNQVHKLTRIAFAKHLAIAGQGYAPKPQKLIRTIAMFFHYSSYIQSQAFNNGRFSLPPTQLSDPTEKCQFSNLAGKAIADFLSKRIDQSFFTVNYEAAMRLRNMPIRGGRPDLLAYKQGAIFAIEAKGFSTGHGNMSTHKIQSQTGGIPVNFSVASVSYDLYKNVKCKYHDPFIDNITLDNELLRNLSRNYYQGLSEFLNQDYFEYFEFDHQEESFYEIKLLIRKFEKFFSKEILLRDFRNFREFDFYIPKIILPKRIKELAENGLTSETKPFIFETRDQDEYLYIDNDRVGLAFPKL